MSIDHGAARFADEDHSRRDVLGLAAEDDGRVRAAVGKRGRATRHEDLHTQVGVNEKPGARLEAVKSAKK